MEGGAADRYGKLNVGDQILNCEGVSLLDVTHNEAAQALKRAMDMESVGSSGVLVRDYYSDCGIDCSVLRLSNNKIFLSLPELY